MPKNHTKFTLFGGLGPQKLRFFAPLCGTLRRMGIFLIRSKSGGLPAALLMCSSSAHATSQCPREFGQKDPLVDAIGWLVVAVGIIVGGLLFTYIIRRSRGISWFSRSIVIIIGFAGMLLVWIGGYALAFVNFFFKC